MATESTDNKTVVSTKTRLRDNLIGKYRLPINIGTRYPQIPNASPVNSSIEYDPDDPFKVAKSHVVGMDSVPFNFLLNSIGGCAIKKIVFDGRDTIVLFDSGDRTVVTCAETDSYDRMTAVAWAVMKCAFGRNCARQISKAIRQVGVDATELRAIKAKEKEDANAFAEATGSEDSMTGEDIGK